MSEPQRPGDETKALHHLTRVIDAATAFFGALLLAIIAYTGWSANLAATERERALLDNAFNQSIARALNEQKSVAWWDDSVVKITNESIDLDFVDANFGIFLTETYGHDEVYILDGADQPLYAFAEAARGAPALFESRRKGFSAILAEVRRGAALGFRNRPDAFGAAQSNYRVLAGAVQAARWAGHILTVDGRPAVVAALTIVPNVDMSLLKVNPNLLISVTYIDEAFISEIGRSLLLPDLSLQPAPRQQAGIVNDPFVGDDNMPAGELSWTTQRPGQRLITVILPLVAVGVVATGVLANAILRRLIRASSELAQREQQARHASKHDALSGLPNRAHMVEKIEEFLEIVEGGSRTDRAIVAYIDIDRFKDINDTLGHHAGDQLIKSVALRLQSCLRPGDFLARFGGDELALLCTAVSTEGGAALARRIAEAFAEPFTLDGQSIRVTTSVGIAIAPDHGTTTDDLMRHADIALYEAKNQGRNRAVLFSSDMAEQLSERRSIELDLRAALEADALALNYQPVISCKSGGISGLEALLRWHHPVRGHVSPDVFIPIAENCGLLPSLGAWVLNRAMTDSKRWPNLEIAINLSPVQFRHVDLGALLQQLILEHNVDPGRFVLEITEGVLLEGSERTKRTLDEIRELGFKIALDDFGTGYSSLAYLCKFTFDKIKIDRSFVNALTSSQSSRTIVQSVVRLGRGLGMGIVAEGVESEIEAVMMTHFGCTELQGFYFSKALAPDSVNALLESFEPKTLPQMPAAAFVSL